MSILVDDGNNAGAAPAPAATAAVTPPTVTPPGTETACNEREAACDRTASFMARVIPWPKDAEPSYCNLHWTVPDKAGMRGRAYTNIANSTNLQVLRANLTIRP